MKKREHNEIKSKYLKKKEFFSQAWSGNLMFLLYFILVWGWQVFYHLPKYHLRCHFRSEQERVSIHGEPIQNPVKWIKSISTLSTLFVLRTFITIIAIKLNGAIWDQVPIILLHIHCKRCFSTEQVEERSILWGKMGYRNEAQRNESHSEAYRRPMTDQLLAFRVPAVAFPKSHLKMVLSQLSTLVLASGAVEEHPRWGNEGLAQPKPWSLLEHTSTSTPGDCMAVPNAVGPKCFNSMSQLSHSSLARPHLLVNAFCPRFWKRKKRNLLEGVVLVYNGKSISPQPDFCHLHLWPLSFFPPWTTGGGIFILIRTWAPLMYMIKKKMF